MEKRERGCLLKRAVSFLEKRDDRCRWACVNAGQKAHNSTTAAPNASQVAMTMYCTFSGCPEHIYESAWIRLSARARRYDALFFNAGVRLRVQKELFFPAKIQ